MVIGHEKGRETEDKVKRNFGMPQPEGYRKAKRLMQLAERFNLPVITFIDTAGAYPGIEGEERGQSEAIATNLAVMSKLKTPIIVIITGEGGSGGALAIGVGDHIAILEHATYSVASPEACASIIWRTAEKASDAAEAMKVSAQELIKIKIVDEIIKLSTAPTQIKSSKFITKESCAIPFQTERSPVSFQYIYARELLVPAPSACITIQCSSDPEM